MVVEWFPPRIVVAIVHDEEAEHKAQRETSGIAHEEFLALGEDIEIEEHGHYAETGGREHGMRPLVGHDTENEDDEQGDATKPRCESVDAIDKVDGIDDVDDHQHREGHAYPGRNGVNAEESTEIVDPQIA